MSDYDVSNSEGDVLLLTECQSCGKCFTSTEEIKMCCSGLDCGCLGLPIDPVLCEECEKKIFNSDK